MQHLSFPSADIILLPQNNECCFIDVIFFFNDIPHYDAHLIEHLILNPHRNIILNGHNIALEDCYSSLCTYNGFTAGAFLAINFFWPLFHATSIWEIISWIISSPLYIDESILENEKNIIHHEMLFWKQTLFDKDAFTSLYPQKKTHHITVEDIQETYKKLIQKNKPLVIIRGDQKNKYIQNVIEQVSHNTCQKIYKHNTTWDIFYSRQILQYHPNTEYRDIVLFFSMHYQTLDYDILVFISLILQEIMFEYIRYQEKSNYDVPYMYRQIENKRECYYVIYTQLGTQWLQDILQNVFDIDTDTFAILKDKVIMKCMYRQTLWFEKYYYIAQQFYRNKYSTIEDMIPNIRKISFQDFMKYYIHHRLPNVSIITQEDLLNTQHTHPQKH